MALRCVPVTAGLGRMALFIKFQDSNVLVADGELPAGLMYPGEGDTCQ